MSGIEECFPKCPLCREKPSYWTVMSDLSGMIWVLSEEYVRSYYSRYSIKMKSKIIVTFERRLDYSYLPFSIEYIDNNATAILCNECDEKFIREKTSSVFDDVLKLGLNLIEKGEWVLNMSELWDRRFL